MSQKISIRRYVVCVDNVDDSWGGVGPRNLTNIERTYVSVRRGCFQDEKGRTVRQDVKYCQVVSSGTTLAGKLGSKSTTLVEQQIRDLVLDICEHLESPTNEIFLFASGQGAYAVRAIAGILHHMGIPNTNHLKDFEQIYNTTLELIKARKADDSRRGDTALQYLRSVTHGTANIQFVGLFDATKPLTDKNAFDTSITSTIRNFRHAMAFNEKGVTNSLDTPKGPEAKDLAGRSFIQAWFLGSHRDLVGGSQHDGFSIYPLQWIMIEAMLSGLYLSFDMAGDHSVRDNPLELAFPHYAGHAPDLSGSENILWQLRYANSIVVKMFELQSIHVPNQKAEETSHSLHFESISRLYNAPRKIFNQMGKGLKGYESERPHGTIIHPSIFCILDRNQRFLEHSRFKPYKENLADFETDCLHSDATNLPPWFHESELLASGVKAFRILVCGKTGVGKSTLINKVFGVEMTEESNSYAQGQHDINTAFESPNHPGLLIHDSRGWQAGSDQELELIARFLRHRAFQKEPSEALHVIWFCVDSDVSRIEEADRKTFQTIAQYSNTVPVFLVGTKKDKMLGYHKMAILEDFMQKSNDYQECSRLAEMEANEVADAQFATLLGELSQIKSYKVDGYVCISRNDSSGIRSLLTQTLDTISDERVRIFCVAAQVVDVDKKIDSAITECMRLGTHAIRTAMVPLPFSGVVGTPTVSRIICEHVLQCFGFPKAVPDEVDEVLNRIVMGNLKKYLALSLAQFVVMASASSALAVPTVGASAVVWLASPFLSAPPSARMLLKCSAEMILILERSFRYNGKYVSVKQIEDAAKQYVSTNTTTFGGQTEKLQDHVRDQIDRLVPLKKIAVGFRFKKLRTGLEHVVYRNRFDQPPEYAQHDPLAEKMAEIDASFSTALDMPGDLQHRAELPGDAKAPIELDSTPRLLIAELPGSEPVSPRGGQLVAKLRAKWS